MKHTCICFSTLTIKTFFTSSDHLTALGPSVSISCTQRVFPLPCSGAPCAPQTNSWGGRFLAPSVDRQGYCTKGQTRQFKWQKCVVSQLSGCEGRCIVVHSEVVREVSATLSLLHCLFYGCSHFMWSFMTCKYVPCADFSSLRTPIFLDQDSPSGVSLTWLSRETLSELVQTKHFNTGNLGEDTATYNLPSYICKEVGAKEAASDLTLGVSASDRFLYPVSCSWIERTWARGNWYLFWF